MEVSILTHGARFDVDGDITDVDVACEIASRRRCNARLRNSAHQALVPGA
jgi:hypothetical protein